ncbi:hypothetical protein [Salipaludibacillus agaradhaerens]|uniref:hypothetical protein n=1 Tax=Salipaludibacillus agaradhaerens TaxID=76935 RepID=UPI0009961DA5|nr:hypothetical protein [Salipaludibacillus agaradhaerens]
MLNPRVWILSSLFLMLAACSHLSEEVTDSDNTSINSNEYEREHINNEEDKNEHEGLVVAETDAGEFILRLISEKAVYESKEQIQLTGKLQYKGEREELEIIHVESPLYFELHEVDRGVELLYYPTTELEEKTVLKQKEWYEEDYVKRISYSETDEHADFFHSFMEEPGFPPGEYEIELRADFTILQEGQPITHQYATSLVIEVR